MKKSFMRFLVFAIVIGIAILLVPAITVNANPPAQGGIPKIPHSLDGRSACLVCHEKGVNGAPKYPPDHAGRTNEMCQACHQPGTTTQAPSAGATPAPTTAAGGIPQIPHPLEGRDACLACHQTGVGGAPKLLASHAGRTNDMCQGCHKQKAVAPVVVPTQIAHPPASSSQNSCVDCHKTLGGKSADAVTQWTSSIHATRGVTCTDCHGGDATKSTKEAAHATSAGYVGKPKTQDVPALCASCHARVDLMRQYDIATDQYAQYQDSVHGQKTSGW
jgi:predicted CXXCH cytochrome family protein